MYGLLGKKLAHSLSPQIHSYLPSSNYSLFEREENELDSFFQNPPAKAFNVTIPYKIEAFKRCTVLSDIAQRIGSVNTVIYRDNGEIYGDNTDYFGFSYMADFAGCDFKDKKVVILGSGGASLTVKLVCQDRGAREIVVISRTGEENYENLYRHYDAQILVNTTPVGMYTNNGETPCEISKFTKCERVLDLIYNPSKTRLILEAEKCKIKSANGLSMLVAQAVKSSQQFNDTEIDERIIPEIIKKNELEQKNIALIGMPGCGKSTIGKLLAKELSREFSDTDSIIEERWGAIPNIFEKYGEDEFRNRESQVVAECSKLCGKVIATGGGAILKEENRLALRENSTVFYLKRDLDKLATFGRPLSKDRAILEELFEKRNFLYKETADFSVEVEEDFSETVKKIIAKIYENTN